jgi:general secretion pathway protein G
MNNSKKDFRKEKGFTLIELLVVIAIIAILSTVVMAGLNSARLKGRDAKRLADVKQMQAAMELYFDSCGGYPSMGSAGAYSTWTTTATGNTAFQAATTPTCAAGQWAQFMASVPFNPAPGGANYGYCANASGAAVGAASCAALSATTAYGGYQMTFTLEGQSGSLPLGAHTATPSGII